MPLEDEQKEPDLRAIWNAPWKNPATMGIYPLGTDNEIEIPYRHYHEVKTLRPWLPPAPYSMLELGCGTGRWALELAGDLSSYTGIDLSKAQLELAVKLARDRKLTHLKFIEADVSAYDFTENYDVIYDGACTQYLNDEQTDGLLEKLSGRLPSGGVLVVRATVPYESKQRYMVNDGSYFSIYRTESEIVGLTLKHGFKLKNIEQTYLYLRDKASWKSEELYKFIYLGIKLYPEATFELMKAYASMYYDKPESYRVVDAGVKLVHKFFIFHKK